MKNNNKNSNLDGWSSNKDNHNNDSNNTDMM